MGSNADRDAQAELRRERLAAALRENLKRRKARARAQRAIEPPTAKPERLPDGSH
jgi:hypothetical protein